MKDYKYKALVIDDESNIKQIIDSCNKILKKQYDINIDFHIVNKESDYKENLIYDILLVDYSLDSGFSNTKGDYYIKKVREKNKFCRIIFYSTQFSYSKSKIGISLKPELIYKIINDYDINSIVDKSNTRQLVEELKKNCDQIDYLPIALSRIYDEYSKEGLSFEYSIDGNLISSDEMRNNVLLDNEIGKKFRVQLFESFIQKYIKIGL